MKKETFCVTLLLFAVCEKAACEKAAVGQEVLTEKQFVDIVDVKDRERVEAMEGEFFQVTGYCWLEKRSRNSTVLMIRPLTKKLPPGHGIVVLSAPAPHCCFGRVPNLEQRLRQRIKNEGSPVRVTIQAIARSRLKEERPSGNYEPPSHFVIEKNGNEEFVFEGDLDEKQLATRRLEDARKKQQTETVPVARLWMFYDAYSVPTPRRFAWRD